jgi:iron complex outermembrane receptor protein
MIYSFLLLVQIQLFQLIGVVKNENNEPVKDAVVLIQPTNQQATTDSSGKFVLNEMPAGTYEISILHVGYLPIKRTVEITNNTQLDFNIQSYTSEEVVVEGFRANDDLPITKTTLDKQAIQEKYFGYDVPYVINNTPSINAYSDNGIGTGYTYFRMRGIDQSRVNLTINGIPTNDPENHGYYFNNFSDLSSSAESIQIQRGVSTSTNGTAAFGGAINITTAQLSTTPNAAVHLGYGSFNTSRVTVESNTGLINDKFAFYGKVSNIQTDGYRDHSGNKLTSYFLSGAAYGKKSVLKLNAFGGFANNELSYLGIDKNTLANNRTFNPLTESEKDYFNQNFFQLQYNKTITSKINISASAYHVRGNGWFDVRFYNYPYAFMNMPDVTIGSTTLTSTNFMARYWLKQKFTGAYATINYQSKKWNNYIGIHANNFSCDHYMTVPWAEVYPTGMEPNNEAYFNTGTKQDISGFAKATYSITKKWLMYADLQLRYTAFQYKAEDKPIYRDTFNVEKMNWLFLNPKLGVKYLLSEQISLYTSIGKTSREPARIDYMMDDRAISDIKQSDVKPEEVIDIELGADWKKKQWMIHLNAYAMEFKNEIVLTGELNGFGYPLRKNAESSFRRGIELEFDWKINKYFSLFNASNFSYNRIKTMKQQYNIYDGSGNYVGDSLVVLNNTQPLYTPSIMVNQGIRIQPIHWIHFEMIGKYMGASFLDNANLKETQLPSFFFVDARLNAKLPLKSSRAVYSLSIQANNIFNQLYAHSGNVSVYGYSLTQNGSGGVNNTTAASYLPAATRNFMVTLSAQF